MTFEQIVELIRSEHVLLIYGVLVLSAFIENIFPPFPGDAVMLAGAYLAGEGNITYIGVLSSVTVGGLGGAMTLYAIGFSKGRKFFETGRGKRLVKSNLKNVDSLFLKYGTTIVLASRFVAGVRSAIAVSAGIARYDVKRMVIFTSMSFLLWYGLLTTLMIYSKSNWRVIVDIVKQYNIVLIIIGVVILIVWIARALWIRRSSK